MAWTEEQRKAWFDWLNDMRNTPMVKNPAALLDRTTLERYAACPHQGYLCDKHKIEINDAKLATMGQIGHELVEESLKYVAEYGGDSVDVADYCLQELSKVRPDLQPEVIEASNKLMKMLMELPIHKIIGVERQLDFTYETVKTKDDRPITITCCADLMVEGEHDTLHFIDFKFGYKKRSKEETYNNFQAQFNTLLAWKLWPKNYNTVHFWFWEVRWGLRAYACFERNATKPYMPDLTTEDIFEARVMEAIKYYITENNEAWPEEQKCTWCPAVTKCKYASQRAMDIAENPSEFLDNYIVLNVLVDKYKDALTDYYKANGPIIGTDSIFEWRPAKPKFTPKHYKKG